MLVRMRLIVLWFHTVLSLEAEPSNLQVATPGRSGDDQQSGTQHAEPYMQQNRRRGKWHLLSFCSFLFSACSSCLHCADFLATKTPQFINMSILSLGEA
eukprot:3343299-Amphidinium_carterae.1